MSGSGGGWFLDGLDPAVAEALVALGEERTFEEGSVVFREDEDTPFLGIVRSGRLALRTRLPGRGNATLLTVEAGDVFGWSALTRPHSATATVVAVAETRACCIEADRLRGALDSDPGLAAPVQRRVLEAIARRMAAHRMQLLDVYGAESGAPT